MARITDIELEELAEMADGWRANNRTIEVERAEYKRLSEARDRMISTYMAKRGK